MKYFYSIKPSFFRSSPQAKLQNNKGITLIEIIVASIIAMTVLASLASMDYAVRMMYKNRGSRGMLSVETTSILLHMARNIQLARSDATFTGIEISGGGTALSILQDKNETPQNYADDPWVCYELKDAGIEFCTAKGSCMAAADTVTLGSGRIKSFKVGFTTNSTTLENQVRIVIEACVDPATCIASEFTTETTISAVSTGGQTI